MRMLLVLLVALFGSTPATAVDGVLEINAACAVETGCFEGDAAGYPVTITGVAGSSYRLTGDLTFSGSGTTAIRISTSHVDLDLNGFRIQCSNFTPPSTVEPCGATLGGGDGIEVIDREERPGIRVHNGSIVGMGGNGLILGPSSIVHRMRVSGSAASGIVVGSGSSVSESLVFENGLVGIFAGEGSSVSSNLVHGNGTIGISTSASTVEANVVEENGESGIDASTDSPIIANVVAGNFGSGIVALSGSDIRGNAVSTNGSSNSGHGLFLSSGTVFRENVIRRSNVGAGTVAGGADGGGNVCGGTLGCP